MSVADCEQVQTSWFRYGADELGGRAWVDDGLLWVDGPDGLNLMFPARLSRGSVRRGVERARELGRNIVGAWLAGEVDATVLAEAGFERGWAPWWMSAALGDVPRVEDPRVRLAGAARDDLLGGDWDGDRDYAGEHAGYRARLALAGGDPPRAWYAAAHTADGRFAGRAWSFRDERVRGGDPCGIFDMEVWPPFRRQGFGRALLSAVCTAAQRAGATHAILNATPEGRALYEACGFRPVGAGITWWLHLGAADDS